MEPFVIVLFGATGDLARRKLWPGMRHLFEAGLMPDEVRIIGAGREAPDHDLVSDWPRELHELVTMTSASADHHEDLVKDVKAAHAQLGDGSRTLFYMSVPPSAMTDMVDMLGRSGLADDRARIVMEKPFGHDVDSAKALNAELHEHFEEDQIFRIDHFLGKEAAQDVLALRFANRLFEPLWNRHHVAQVRIDVPEELGLEGRASFYEETGCFRDMVVTHLCQVLGFVAMEPPASLDAGHLRDRKAEAFEALRPFTAEDAIYGQFEGYRDEDGVARDSTVETFVALRAWVDNDRWRGVPFYLRTGKAMAQAKRTVEVVLRETEADLYDGEHAPNIISFELLDDPQLAVQVRVKVPGPTSAVAPTALSVDVDRALRAEGLEAYERLLHDVFRGDHLLFTRADEVETLWERAAPLLADPPEAKPYKKGSWGPEAAVAWFS
jgi:glucose-6-phosphate 1-dehydrogenase